MASAQFSNPYGILYGNTGLVVADSSNAKLRRLYAGGLQKACDDLDACTTDACDNKTGNCSHQPIANCCQPVKQHWTFGPGSDNTGWTLQKCAAGSSSTPTGCSTVSGASPSKGWQFWDAAKQSNLSAGALYYGDPTPSTPNFNFGASAGAATSPTWVVPASGSKMLASLWWDTEGGTTYDQLFVYLLVDGKIAKTVLQKGTGAYVTSKKWYNLDVDVSAYVGKSVQLQVYFNTKDSVANSGQGIYVDDVKVSAPCN
jgi:hypothetical protein